MLFLDELPEFGRDVLESLRQPLEEGRVVIARAGRATTFPARFQLLAAMNPCPCGFAGSPEGGCTCPSTVVERYERRVSGPLRDRIDLTIDMPRVEPSALVGDDDPEPSVTVAARIVAARAVATGRIGRSGRAASNARLRGPTLRAACGLDAVGRRSLVLLADEERASGRGTERLLRVARTIADLDGHDRVRVAHIEEAAHFRRTADRRVRSLSV